MVKDYCQPSGFSIFFLTEMWERYGFYVIQTLLVFYLLNVIHLKDKQAYVMVGSFTALAYINSVFGGLVADRFIGYNNAIIIGGVFLFVGYFILMFSQSNLLVLGASSITVGTGFLKSNVSSMLGILYHKEDTDNVRKDAGYTLYYIGIHVGALGGGLLGGYLNHWFGHGVAFATASIGMLFSLCIFIYGAKKYNLYDHRYSKLALQKKIKVVISIGVLTIVSYIVLKSEFFSTVYFILVALFCLGFILYNIAIHHGMQRNKLIAFLILILLSVLYWAIYFQQYFSISLCIQRACRLTIPASSMSAVESLGIIFFGLLANRVWFRFKKKGRLVSIPTRFSLGFLFNGFCFLCLVGGLWYAGIANTYLSIWFIIVAYLFVAIGELFLSPTSLSMVTSLVPQHLTASMMGISLLSIGFGGKLAGLLASDSALKVSNVSLDIIRHTYLSSFFTYFMISIITYIVVVLLIKHVNKLVNVKGENL